MLESNAGDVLFLCCTCKKTFDCPDDGPAGPKHVEKNCKCKKKRKIKVYQVGKEIKKIFGCDDRSG